MTSGAVIHAEWQPRCYPQSTHCPQLNDEERHYGSLHRTGQQH